jgi:hypothetical protein
MFRCNHHHQGAHYLSLLKLRLLKHDDCDYTEICWSCFKVNFNTPFKAIFFYISWR